MWLSKALYKVSGREKPGLPIYLRPLKKGV